MILRCGPSAVRPPRPAATSNSSTRSKSASLARGVTVPSFMRMWRGSEFAISSESGPRSACGGGGCGDVAAACDRTLVAVLDLRLREWGPGHGMPSGGRGGHRFGYRPDTPHPGTEAPLVPVGEQEEELLAGRGSWMRGRLAPPPACRRTCPAPLTKQPRHCVRRAYC